MIGAIIVAAVLGNEQWRLVAQLADPPVWIPVALVAIAVVYFVTLILLLPAAPRSESLSIREYLLRTLVSSLLTILAFAYMHAEIGVMDGNVVKHDPMTALYFSMVTFSTLGYGDVSPELPLHRIGAAAQALIGNLHLGLFVAGAFFLLESSIPRAEPVPDTTEPEPTGRETGITPAPVVTAQKPTENDDDVGASPSSEKRAGSQHNDDSKGQNP